MKKIILLISASVLASFTFANAQLTAEEQQVLTPDTVLEELMAGNSRYMAGEVTDPDIVARIAATAEGQHPKAVILSDHL